MKMKTMPQSLLILLAVVLAPAVWAQELLAPLPSVRQVLRPGPGGLQVNAPAFGPGVRQGGPAGGFMLEMTYQTRTPQRVLTQTCAFQGEKTTRETTVVDHGVTTTSKEEWAVELSDAEDIAAWLEAAEGGSLTTGRYIPSRRWAPTVTYGARRSEGGSRIYLSYDGPFHWERNSSETARVMLESVIDRVCRR